MFAEIGSVVQYVNMLVKPSSLVDAIVLFYQTTWRDVTECSVVAFMTIGPSGRTVCCLVGISGLNPNGNMDVFLSCVSFALLDAGLCEGLITPTEDPYRV
jgi:hypothetical protein